MDSDVEYNPALCWKFFRRYMILALACFIVANMLMFGIGTQFDFSDPRPIYFIGTMILFLPFPLMGMHGLKNGYSLYWGWIRVCYGPKAKFWNWVWIWLYPFILVSVTVMFIYEGPDV